MVPVWSHQPVGPFFVYGIDPGYDPMPLEFDALDEAMHHFVTRWLHPRIAVGMVVDGSDRLLVGYESQDPDALEGRRWWGCEAGFAALEPFVNPIDHAFWYLQAQGYLEDVR